MPKFLVNRWHGMHIVWALILIFALTVALTWYQWIFGLIGLVLGGAVGVFGIFAERAFRKELNEYVLTLTYRMKGAAQDVLGRLHRDRQRAVHPAALARARVAGPEVGRRRGHDQHVRAWQLAPHRRLQVAGALDAADHDAGRWRQRDRTRDEHHLGSTLPRGLGHPVSHLAAGAVGDDANRVDGLTGGTRGHHDPASGQSTTAAEHAHARAAQIGGVADVLQKPFEMDDLLEIVSRYVDKKTSVRS